jgi:hypothetical protein
MRDTSKVLFLTVGVLGFLTFISGAGANTIFAPNPPTITFIDANHHRWDYDVIVSQGSEVRSGDGFTIYDFAGFRGVGGTLPAGWSLNSSQTNAPDYPFQTRASTDNAAIIDLILSYSGPINGNANANTDLGTFSFISDFNLRASSFFESSDHTIFNGVAQTDNHNTQVPVGVPEPAAMCGALGFLGVMFTAGRPRKRNQVRRVN